MKKIFRPIVAVVALSAMHFATAEAAEAAETEFTASAWLPPSHPVTKYGYTDWMEKIERESEGSLKPRLFTGSALLAPADHLSGVRDGIADFGWISGT